MQDIFKKLVKKPKGHKCSPKQKRMASVTDLVLGIDFTSEKHPLNKNYIVFINEEKRSKRHDFI